MPNSAQRTISAKDIQFILDRLNGVSVENFRNEQILLTGATGFFGKWLTQTLFALNDKIRLNNSITILTRDRKRAQKECPWLLGRKDLSWIETDIRELEIQKITTRFSTIIHGAATASRELNEKKPTEMFDTIVIGTQRVLELIALGKNVKRLLFISSGAVYGTQVGAPLSELDSTAPDPFDSRSCYGEAKRAAEMLCAAAARVNSFDLKVARCFAFIGPYLPLDRHFAAGNFLRNAIRGETIIVGGDGTPKRSYLYAADLAVWLVRILLEGQPSRAYNVGSDQSLTIRELAEKIQILSGKALDVSILKDQDPLQKGDAYIPSIVRARSELEVAVWTNLEDSILKTIEWHLKKS